MRRSNHHYPLKIVSFAFAGLFLAIVLAALPLPTPEIGSGIVVVSALPVPIALAAVESSESGVALAAQAASVPEDITVDIEAQTPNLQTPPSAVVPVKQITKNTEARLRIPRIGVEAVIKEMGYTPEGAMAVPNNRFEVGWFEPGTRPGKTGSAVIGGHNEWAGAAGVFQHLDQLVYGDVLSVVDAQGASTSYVVMGTQTFDADDEESGIFESVSGAHLNLITCSGVWNPATGTYTTRLVVFTDLILVP